MLHLFLGCGGFCFFACVFVGFGWFWACLGLVHWQLFFVVLCVLFGEFDPGSGRTLAACLTHASRTERPSFFVGVLEWRTGE